MRRLLPDRGLEDLSLRLERFLVFRLFPSSTFLKPFIGGGLSSSSESYMGGGQSSSISAGAVDETVAEVPVYPPEVTRGVSHLLPRLPLFHPLVLLAPLPFLPHCWSRALSFAGL